MNDDPYAERRRLTFEQAEGVEPLPGQLKPREMSDKVRSMLWNITYESVKTCAPSGTWISAGTGGPYVSGAWRNILHAAWVERDHKPTDEFRSELNKVVQYIKPIFFQEDYAHVYGFLQFALRHPDCPPSFAMEVDASLQKCHAAYRVIENTIVPIASDQEAETLGRAFADLTKEELHGARSHLRSAGSNLTDGDYAASIRESIHSVEGVVYVITGSSDLQKGLNKIDEAAPIHGAFKSGLDKFYGYTSNEKGIRHSLLDQEEAPVDEADALFMIGACAAFVSYLINKVRSAGLLDRNQFGDVAKRVDGRDEHGHHGG